MKLLLLLGGLLTMATTAFPAQAAEPIQVMIVGSYHFGNPGRDLNNVEADDVTVPKRQAELAALSRALAEFGPTKVMVERVAKAADLVDPNYRGFTPTMLSEDPDERVQIGYRLAHTLKLDKVYAIDEQPGPGEPDYFPFGKVAEFAKANGMGGRIDALMKKGAAITRQMEEKQRTASIAELLVDHNAAAGPASSIDIYYELLGIGDAEQQPGAELNAMWYMRNAKIFAKLAAVAEPGDRVLVVYGSGHNYWLRHFAQNTPGFVSVDPVPYLLRAAAAN